MCGNSTSHCRPWHHGEFAPDGATIVDIGVAYRAHQYLSVDGAINGRVLNDAQKQGLGGCFDVSGNRADFSVLLLLLREELNAARDHATMSEEEQQELLFGPADAVWKHDRALLDALEERTVALEERPSVHVAALDMGSGGHRRVVQQLLSEAGGETEGQVTSSPMSPFGKQVAGAAVVHCEQKNAAFNGALQRNEARLKGHMTSTAGDHPFAPKYEHDPSNDGQALDEEEAAVLERVTLPASTAVRFLDPGLVGADADPRIRIQRVFHGVPSLDVAHAILCGDFAALQTTDAGYFGSGLYFTPDLDYALRYADPSLLEVTSLPEAFGGVGLRVGHRYQVVLACDVQYGNPYPVLDADECNGQPFTPGHDAHVAVVRSPRGEELTAVKPFASSEEWAEAEGDVTTRPLAEIAINDPSCVTVRAVLVFEA